MKTLSPVAEIAGMFNSEMASLRQTCEDSTNAKEEVYEELCKKIDAVCTVLRQVEDDSSADPKLLRSMRTKFQIETDKTILHSYCIRRARTWPQGHQGDYKTLETLYRNTPLSRGMAYYFDLWALSRPLAVAVRNRISILQSMLSNEMKTRKTPSVLNIACGSCRELMDLVADIKHAKARVMCIDDDSDALSFALNRVSYTVASSRIRFLKYNALRMFDHDNNLQEFGKQDVIYSVGLFDYLPDDFLVTLIRSLYRLLNEEGKLILAFKDAAFYDSVPYHWIVDWDGFKQRRQGDFSRILENASIPPDNILTMKDPTQIISFYEVTKTQ